MDKISDNITLAEATKSQYAIQHKIDNNPDVETTNRMRLLALKIFEPVRFAFNTPIYISSFFRSVKLNKALKGAKNSQHVKGEAMDIDADMLGGCTNAEIFKFIKDNLVYDQLIWEKGTDENPAWVHVSYKETGNRKQTLRYKDGNYYKIA